MSPASMARMLNTLATRIHGTSFYQICAFTCTEGLCQPCAYPQGKWPQPVCCHVSAQAGPCPLGLAVPPRPPSPATCAPFLLAKPRLRGGQGQECGSGSSSQEELGFNVSCQGLCRGRRVSLSPQSGLQPLLIQPASPVEDTIPFQAAGSRLGTRQGARGGGRNIGSGSPLLLGLPG